jgi:hypothetical protein
VALGLAPAVHAAEVPGDAGFLITGTRTGAGQALVRVRADLDENGTYERLATSFNPYPGSRVADGVRVATGDFDGDFNEDLIVSAGNGLPVRIFELNPDGTVGNLVDSRKVFGGRGVFVAAGDLNGDQRAELIVAAGSGNPNVRIFSDADFDGRVLDNETDTFLAFPSGFKGGVRVATADTNDVGAAEVITASASAGRRIKIWTDSDLDRIVSNEPLLEDVKVYSSSFKGGLNVAAGTISGVGGSGAELVIAPAAGKGKVVVRTDTDADGRVFDNPASESFYPYGSGWSKGVRLGAGDSDHSGSFVEVFTAPAALAGRKAVRIYDDTLDPGAVLHDNPITQAFRAFPTSVKAGAYVALGRVNVKRYMSPTTATAIPDPGTATSNLWIPSSAGRIRNLTVILNLTHTFDADLDVTLTHVTTGTSVSLFTDAGGSGDGFLVLLNDGAGTDIASVVPATSDTTISGTFRPEAPATLATFAAGNPDASGLWRLTVTDDFAAFSGTISSWGLDVVY